MEFGDIIYLILMFAFLVFGIFKDSGKKQKKVSKSTQPVNSEEDFRELVREIFQRPQREPVPPPTPKAVSRKQPVKPIIVSSEGSRPVFQSSMELVTDFEGASSLKESAFMSQLFSDREELKPVEKVHPVLEQLRGGEGVSEIRKAVIYSELLERKYC